MQDRVWFCFTKLGVQSWKGNQNSMGLSWKRLREACMQCLPKQFLLIYFIYRRPEGNSIPIYESVGQKSPVSDSSRSLRVLWESVVLFRWQNVLRTSLQSFSFPWSEVARTGWCSQTDTNWSLILFFCVCVCVCEDFCYGWCTSGFYCTPEFSLCFKRQNRKRNTSTVKCAGNILKRSYKGWMDLLHPRLLSFQYFFLEEEGENVPFQEASHCWMQGIKLTLNIKMTGSQTNLNWNLKSWMFHK